MSHVKIYDLLYLFSLERKRGEVDTKKVKMPRGWQDGTGRTMLASKSDDLSSVPGTQRNSEGKKQLHNIVL